MQKKEINIAKLKKIYNTDFFNPFESNIYSILTFLSFRDTQNLFYAIIISHHSQVSPSIENVLIWEHLINKMSFNDDWQR